MKIRYWGVRGSIPVPGAATVRVGGNTPCVSVELADATLVILDGGTGLRGLGVHLMGEARFARGEGRATLLISHRHWDHIHGIPFFEPAYVAGNRFDLYAPAGGPRAAPLDDNVVAHSYAPDNFPVPYAVMKAAYRFHAVSAGEPFAVGCATVEPVRLNHPGHTLGYVLTEHLPGGPGESGRSVRLAYLIDTGPWEELLFDAGGGGDRPAAADGAILAAYRARVEAAIAGADLVIHDTFFDARGYDSRRSWGHSTPGHAIALCQAASVRRLHLFHYAPDLDDAAVAALEAEAQRASGVLEVTAAVEGMEVTLR